MTGGILETIDGRPALRFDRTLAHSVERVWRAITDPQRARALVSRRRRLDTGDR